MEVSVFSTNEYVFNWQWLQHDVEIEAATGDVL